MAKQKDTRDSAQAVIYDDITNKIAVLEMGEGDYHKIPGGGIEQGEGPEQAVFREAMERAACEVELAAELGESEFENPDVPGQFKRSVCYLALKTDDHKDTEFTEEERRNKFKLLWLSFDEAISLLESPKIKNGIRMEMNRCDLKFVKMAKEYLEAE